ncbi:MAG TPA: signal peptidase I [Candidatus Omnitrophota bacterium]|nr:signal peptidase I [Candidatus Omnitrophota bacterium]
MEIARNVLIGMAVLLIWAVIRRDRIREDIRFFRRDRRQWLYLKWKNWGEPILIAVVLALFIRAFIVQAYKIPTGSMRPTFLENDRILVDKLSYRFREPKRGEIIVFKYPEDPKKDFVKRLIGFGGETVEISKGNVLIDGKRVEEPDITKNYYYNHNDWTYGKEHEVIPIPKDYYFVLGDNSAQSSDSRNWGFVPKKNLKGKAMLIYWPIPRVKIIRD